MKYSYDLRKVEWMVWSCHIKRNQFEVRVILKNLRMIIEEGEDTFVRALVVIDYKIKELRD